MQVGHINDVARLRRMADDLAQQVREGRPGSDERIKARWDLRDVMNRIVQITET